MVGHHHCNRNVKGVALGCPFSPFSGRSSNPEPKETHFARVYVVNGG